MLRFLVLVLVLANAGYFVWTRADPRVHGFGPIPQTEPEHVKQQLHPEMLRLMSKEEVRRMEALARVDAQPKACLQAGPFAPPQMERLRETLMAIMPVDSWQWHSAKEPARWIIYMGRYPNAGVLSQKRAQVQKLGIAVEPLNSAELEMGLSLGSFTTQDAARDGLERLQTKGLRTARVVQVHGERSVQILKFPAVTDALQANLSQLKPSLGGKPLKACNGG